VPEMKEALIDPNATGPLADTLRTVLLFETGDWKQIEVPDPVSATIGQSYLEAVSWAEEAKQAMAA
jgi:hypothetical protein